MLLIPITVERRQLPHDPERKKIVQPQFLFRQRVQLLVHYERRCRLPEGVEGIRYFEHFVESVRRHVLRDGMLGVRCLSFGGGFFVSGGGLFRLGVISLGVIGEPLQAGKTATLTSLAFIVSHGD